MQGKHYTMIQTKYQTSGKNMSLGMLGVMMDHYKPAFESLMENRRIRLNLMWKLRPRLEERM